MPCSIVIRSPWKMVSAIWEPLKTNLQTDNSECSTMKDVARTYLDNLVEGTILKFSYYGYNFYVSF